MPLRTSAIGPASPTVFSPAAAVALARNPFLFAEEHADPEYWGSDAEEFRPERWLAGLQPKWKYVPFLGGARVCPAQQMVLTQYAFILVRFLQEFEAIENRDPEIAFIEEIKFGKKSRNGVKVAFKVAKKTVN